MEIVRLDTVIFWPFCQILWKKVNELVTSSTPRIEYMYKNPKKFFDEFKVDFNFLKKILQKELLIRSLRDDVFNAVRQGFKLYELKGEFLQFFIVEDLKKMTLIMEDYDFLPSDSYYLLIAFTNKFFKRQVLTTDTKTYIHKITFEEIADDCRRIFEEYCKFDEWNFENQHQYKNCKNCPMKC